MRRDADRRGRRRRRRFGGKLLTDAVGDAAEQAQLVLGQRNVAEVRRCATVTTSDDQNYERYRARQLYKNISMLFLFPVKDGKLSTGVIAIFNASCYG